jgi:outer membrane lipoprotein-sorting protein
MRFFRRASTGRLLLFLAVVTAAAVGVGSGAVAAFGGGGTAPPGQPLDAAIQQALSAPSVDGVSARISFTNHVVSSDVLPEGTGLGPLLAGASGRLWATSDGRFRIELQADNGDTEILSDGQTLTVYDVHANTVYRLQLPARTDSGSSGQQQTPPTIARIDDALQRLGDYATVSGAEPSTVAGQPAYTVRLEPKTSAGLLGAAEVAWDAVRGVPLRVAIYARGDSTPTLELAVTDISYGPVADSDVTITPPASAKVTDLGQLGLGGPDTSGSQPSTPVTGLAAVSAALPFQLVAPGTVGGLALEHVRLVGGQDHPAALLLYGHGLGAIAVLERATPTDTQTQQSPLDNLPTVTINGTKAHELQATLGTILTFDRAGVTYVVAASATPTTIEAAATDLG